MAPTGRREEAPAPCAIGGTGHKEEEKGEGGGGGGVDNDSTSIVESKDKIASKVARFQAD